VQRITSSLLQMAARANTARGASWEHGARCATTLTDAVKLIYELRASAMRNRNEGAPTDRCAEDEVK
jgi:hypothetical protein